MSEDRRVSIVDDEPRIRRLLQEVFEEEGHEVETYADGPAFLESVREEAPDLVLLDINMPQMSGWEVKETLDEEFDLDELPIVAVTGQGGSSIEASAREGLAFDELIRKPFQLDDLLETTRHLLDEP